MAELSFNATAVAPQASFTPIPAGTYLCTITDSEVKITQRGGTVAVFHLQVVDGEFSGRKLFARINVSNPSPEAERIGQAQLSALCHAAGVLQLQDTAQVHGKVIRVRVKVRKDTTGQYGDSNECTGFEAAEGAAPTPAAPAPAAAAPVAPPWKRQAA